MYGKELNDTELLADANLEGYYRFESGAFLTDSSGKGITLTNNNSVASATGQFGNGASSGTSNTNKYLSVNNLFNTTVNSSKTLSVWFKALTELTGSDQYHNIASISYSANNVKYQILYARESSVNKIYFVRQRIGVANEVVVLNTSLGTSVFHRISLVLSSTTMYGFLDGVLVGSVTINTGNGSSSHGNGLGLLAEVNGTTFTDGVIDDVGVLSRAISETEEAALYFNSPRYGDWTGSKRLYVPETKVSGSSNLADFPVVIKDTALPSSVYSGMQSDDDIRFTTDSAGEVVIPYEIVSINRGSNLSEIWVKIPTLSHSLDTQFYVWYGNSSAPAVAANAVVIGSQKVWADERGSYRLQGVTDSSPNGRTLTNNNSVAFNPAQFGNGADTSSSNSSKSLSRADDFGINGSNPPVSISFSVKMQAEISSSYQGFVTLGDGGTFVLYQIYYEYNSGTRRVVFNRQKAGLSNHTFTHNITLGTTDFHRIVLTYDGSTVRGYIDGQSVGSLSISGNGLSGISDIFTIGVADTTRYASANFDEVRVRAGTLSSDWIATEYTMMNDPETFVLYQNIAQIAAARRRLLI